MYSPAFCLSSSSEWELPEGRLLPVALAMEAKMPDTEGLSKHLLNELFYVSDHEHQPRLVLLVLSLHIVEHK